MGTTILDHQQTNSRQHCRTFESTSEKLVRLLEMNRHELTTKVDCNNSPRDNRTYDDLNEEVKTKKTQNFTETGSRTIDMMMMMMMMMMTMTTTMVMMMIMSTMIMIVFIIMICEYKPVRNTVGH